jgi:glucuronoarabinoxylan endo-1,4-beta-xylanase
MDAFVDSLTAGSATDPLTAKLIMPESDTFKTSYTNPIFTGSAVVDSAAYNNIGIIGGHIYGTTPFPYPQPAGTSQKEVWMTEYGPLSSAQVTWPQALTFAQTLHEAMTVAQYNAYVWWGLFGQSTGSCATAAGTCGLVDNSGTPSTVGYVMGQYSKFVQPGYKGAGVTNAGTENTNVLISAYAGTESSTQHFVIVAINMGTSSVSQSFAIQNGTVTSVTPYQSTSAAGLAPQTAVTVTNGQFTYTLPAQSITTFVQ